MDDVTQSVLIAVIGGLVGSVLTLIAMRWSTLRSIDSAKEILRTQLLYEEKKKALKKLHTLVDQRYETYDAFKLAILGFLGTLEGGFLPEELRGAIGSKISELDRFLVEHHLAPPEPSDEDIDRWIGGYEEYLNELPPNERAGIEFENNLRAIKGSIRHLIGKYIEP